jgi:hypothetical protein
MLLPVNQVHGGQLLWEYLPGREFQGVGDVIVQAE